MIILQMEFNNLIWHGETVCLRPVAAPVCLFPASFGCRDLCRALNCISHSFALLAAATLHSRLIKGFSAGQLSDGQFRL